MASGSAQERGNPLYIEVGLPGKQSVAPSSSGHGPKRTTKTSSARAARHPDATVAVPKLADECRQAPSPHSGRFEPVRVRRVFRAGAPRAVWCVVRGRSPGDVSSGVSGSPTPTGTCRTLRRALRLRSDRRRIP
jgi:hypothetical protein